MTAQPPLALSTAGRVREITVYFLKLGTTGFGGPVALVGQMER
jgi:chromate transporter